MAGKYPVRLDQLREHFPPHIPVPPLLTLFGRWLRTKSWGSVGAFELTSSRWNDWGENGGDLYNHFATFMSASEGSQVAFWLPEAVPLPQPPIVLIGSEGQNELLASSFESFLKKLAENRIEVLSGFDLHDRDVAREFKAWFQENKSTNTERSSRWPNFSKWFSKRLEEHRTQLRQDPVRVRLGELLREIEPPPADPNEWWSSSFDVVCVGRSFKLRRMRNRPIAKKKLAEAEELFRLDRMSAARSIPERGAWFSAYATVTRKGEPFSPEGEAHLNRDFYSEPIWEDKPAPISLQDYRSDLLEFPRSRYWTPKWLSQRLRASR